MGPRFAGWAVHTSGTNRTAIDHPETGPITLDYDVSTVAGSDLRLLVHAAQPSSPNADQLRLTQVVGLQRLSPG